MRTPTGRPFESTGRAVCPPLAVTTDEVGPRQAFDRWQDLISDTFVPLAVAPTTDRPFRGRVVHSSVGQVELATVRAASTCGGPRA